VNTQANTQTNTRANTRMNTPPLAPKRSHYDAALDAWLTERSVAFVRVDEARRAILPPSATLSLRHRPSGDERKLKSFDPVGT